MHRWFNQSQPRSLQNAVMLIYLNAGIALFFGLIAGGLYGGISIFTIIGIAGGYGIANDKKWGYYVSIACAGLTLLGMAAALVSGNGSVVISALFEVVLLVLLLQESSREYIRIWFK